MGGALFPGLCLVSFWCRFRHHKLQLLDEPMRFEAWIFSILPSCLEGSILKVPHQLQKTSPRI